MYMIPNHGHISERLQPGWQLRPARWPHSTHNHKYEHERGACFFFFLLDFFFYRCLWAEILVILTDFVISGT